MFDVTIYPNEWRDIMEFRNGFYMIIGFILCLVLMFVIMPPMINYLHKIKFGQTEREEGLESVSYTHLDVYKRQQRDCEIDQRRKNQA